MKKQLLMILSAWILLLLLPSVAGAWTWTPFQLALWEPLQLCPHEMNVYGLRINMLYGSNQNLTGMDMGGLNRVSGKQIGGQIGLMNISEAAWGLCIGGGNYTDTLCGAQMGLLNTAQKKVAGIQACTFLNLSDHVSGLQINGLLFGNGAVSVAGSQLSLGMGYNLTDDITGLQLAGIGFNYANESVHGVQFAFLYNYAKNLTGVQLGLVNACENLSGVQLGLVNLLLKEKMTIMPLVNFRF